MKYKIKGVVAILIWIVLISGTSVKASATLLNGKISGKIADKSTGQPVAGATVAIPDLKTGTSTNANGFYLLKNLPRGKYLMEVSALGYASVIEEIDLGKTETVDFKLTTSSYELADVVVTALGNTTTLQRTPVQMQLR